MAYNTVVVYIEGTVTPVIFVKNALLPYVLNDLDTFLDRNGGTDELSPYPELVHEQDQKDVQNKKYAAVVILRERSIEDIKAAIRKNIQWQMAADRKVGALKAFQGFMWKESYEKGGLFGEEYDYVVPKMDQRRAAGKTLYIYWSGSVPAQKLLVSYSNKGNLSEYFPGYFDTAVGLMRLASNRAPSFS